MSDEPRDAGRWWAWAFVVLMLLAIVWPAPVVVIGAPIFGQPADLDSDSFLGHEAPRWDVVYWAIAGLYAIGLVGSRFAAIRDWSPEWVEIMRRVPMLLRRRLESIRGSSLALAVSSGALAVSLTALVLDERIVVALASIDTTPAHVPVRYANRLAGGQNPLLIIAFFLVAGIALERRRWLAIGIAMTFAGALGGSSVHLFKLALPRARPEQWLGAFAGTDAVAASFPSGHTMAAFAIGGVLALGAGSRRTRVCAVLVVLLVAVARVVSFRHWPSDVLGSMLIGGGLAWWFTRALVDEPEWGGTRSGL